VVAAYANSLANGFALDANALILQDPRIRAATGENLRLIVQNDYWWPTYTLGVYRPLTTLSYLVNWSVLGGGGSPLGYHLLNVLLHMVNVWFVYRLAQRILPSAAQAGFAAALWAIHPIGVECVSNVAGRGDLLAAAAVLGGLLLYARDAHWLTLFAVAVAGVFAKENAAVLIALMVLWDVTYRGFSRHRWPSYAAVAASLALLWIIRHFVYRDAPWIDWPVVDNPLLAAGFWSARLTAWKVVGMYLWLLAFPWRLAYDRSYSEIPPSGWGDASAWLAVLTIAAALAIVIARRRRDPVLFFAAGFFGLALLPTSNLILQIGNIMAERFLYLPAVGFAIAVTAIATRLPLGRARLVIAAAAILLFTARTVARNPAWLNEISLASTDVTSAPYSFRVHEMLAHALHDRGNLDAAIAEEERTWEILRPLPVAWIPVATPMNLGGYYLEKGDAAGSRANIWYEKAVAVLLRGREIAREVGKQWDAAQIAHGRPLRAHTASPNLYFNLGQGYGLLGRYPEAVEAFRFGRAIAPAETKFYDPLAAAYMGLGRREEASMILEEKRLLESGGVASCAAIEDLAKAWEDARRPESARELREKSCAQSGGNR
jgi:hypothetical protein